MGRSSKVKKHVLKALTNGQQQQQQQQQSRQTEKNLTIIVQAKYPDIKTKTIQKVLKKLLKKGKIILDDNDVYRIASFSTTTTTTTTTTTVDEDDSENDDQHNSLEAVPFAERMRRERAAVTNSQTTVLPVKKKSVRFQSDNNKEPELDIDDQIRKLEQELENDVDDSSSSEEEEEENSDKDDQDDCPSETILSLSTLAQDRIAALPSSLLPQAPTKKRGFDKTNEDGDSPKTKRKKKKKQKRGDEEDDDDDDEIKISNGLRAAVKEVLGGYVPRSSEKLPFYCRFCSKQYNDKEEFLSHKTESFHKTAVAMEQKATYCRLCHKQLTSPAQMKEHLLSRPHKERLNSVRQRQGSGRGTKVATTTTTTTAMSASGRRDFKQESTTTGPPRRR